MSTRCSDLLRRPGVDWDGHWTDGGAYSPAAATLFHVKRCAAEWGTDALRMR